MSDDGGHVLVKCPSGLHARRVQVIRRESSHRLTNVNVLQSSQIQSGPNDIGSPLRKQDVPAIVALLDRLQDIR
jgi:hypothetical protein